MLSYRHPDVLKGHEAGVDNLKFVIDPEIEIQLSISSHGKYRIVVRDADLLQFLRDIDSLGNSAARHRGVPDALRGTSDAEESYMPILSVPIYQEASARIKVCQNATISLLEGTTRRLSTMELAAMTEKRRMMLVYAEVEVAGPWCFERRDRGDFASGITLQCARLSVRCAPDAPRRAAWLSVVSGGPMREALNILNDEHVQFVSATPLANNVDEFDSIGDIGC